MKLSWLKKAGLLIVKGVGAASGLVPLAPPQYQPALVKTLNALSEVSRIIIQIEAFGAALQLAGPQKLRMAVVALTPVILQLDEFKGKKIDKPELFQGGVAKVAEGFVDIMNSLDSDSLPND